MSVADELAAAQRALAAGDEDEALDRLIAAWNAARAAPIAAAVHALAERVEARAEPVGGRTQDERYAAVMAAIARGRQGDLGQIVAATARLAYGDVQTALDALLYDWTYTPRITAHLDRVAFPGQRDRVAEMRAHHADARADASLAGAEAQLLAAISELLARGDVTGEALLAAVHADPDDDAPRHVYADWLAARGDPRGELIALQLARLARPPTAAAVRRERALLEAHGVIWLGGLHAVDRGARFARGFPVSVATRAEGLHVDAPEWATVEEVGLTDVDDRRRLTSRLVALKIRRVRGLSADAFAALAPRSGFTHLGLGNHGVPEGPIALASGVRSLGLVGGPERYPWIPPTVSRVQVCAPAADPIAATRWLTAALPGAIRELVLDAWGWELRFTGEARAFTRVDAACANPAVSGRHLAQVLGFAAADSLREIAIAMPRRPAAAELVRVERVARERQRSVQVLTVEARPALALST